MMATIEALCVPLANARVVLQPIAEVHREFLRAACAADDRIWDIYSVNLLGLDFDPAFDGKMARVDGQFAYAVLDGGTVVGCTSWYAVQPGNRAVAIGHTYLVPSARGSEINLAMKGLMIGHAWRVGFERIHFDVDVRNTRSCAAVLKLGCQREATLRRSKITWTGHVRDTAIFSLFPGEQSDALRPWLHA